MVCWMGRSLCSVAACCDFSASTNSLAWNAGRLRRRRGHHPHIESYLDTRWNRSVAFADLLLTILKDAFAGIFPLDRIRLGFILRK